MLDGIHVAPQHSPPAYNRNLVTFNYMVSNASTDHDQSGCGDCEKIFVVAAVDIFKIERHSGRLRFNIICIRSLDGANSSLPE